MVKSVAFVGTMAAGKTTLAQSTAAALGKHKVLVLEETARVLVRENNAPSAEELTAIINDARFDDYVEWQSRIAQRQDRIESHVGFAVNEERSRGEEEWIFADRNVLDCIVYLECCTNKETVDRFIRDPSVVSCLERYKNVLTFLVPPLPDKFDRLDPSNITKDKIRPLLHSGRAHSLLNPQRYHDTFVKVLQRLKLPHVVVTKSPLDERVGEVLAHIKSWNNGQP